MRLRGRVKKVGIPKYSYRWKGYVDVSTSEGELRLYLPASIGQWLKPGEEVELEVEGIKWVYTQTEFSLWRFYEGRRIPIWPPFKREFTLPRIDPATGEELYSYRLLVREAIYPEDFEAIAELEQYHYASKKEKVAIWRCGDKYVEANVRPEEGCILVEIKGSLPVSRFLVMELVDREPFEPKIVGYVRIDPPIPLMHRRVGNRVEKYIRERVFPREWFHPTFWPERLLREMLQGVPPSLRRLKRRELFDLIRVKAVQMCNTAVSRISRVVIHPDYRGDGLGATIVKEAISWVDERDVPEMKKEKVMLETIAQMARYHPFFEKVGFIYLWDTASGRPVLYYPITEEAKRYIESFLKSDPVAREHGGKLYKPRLSFPNPMEGPIILKGVTKVYRSILDVEGLREDVKDVLLSFGVDKRVVERQIFRGVDLEIRPGEVVAVLGMSGAGKTTLLRLISGLDTPDEGEIALPKNARIGVLIPGEVEPEIGETPLLEYVADRVGDVVSAVELLNISGLSDAVLYRARMSELSTGQKERAKVAAVLSERPNILLVDEFASHLDVVTARRLARKISELVRKWGITALLVVHRREILDVLRPDRILYVGYGGVVSRVGTTSSIPSLASKYQDQGSTSAPKSRK